MSPLPYHRNIIAILFLIVFVPTTHLGAYIFQAESTTVPARVHPGKVVDGPKVFEFQDIDMLSGIDPSSISSELKAALEVVVSLLRGQGRIEKASYPLLFCSVVHSVSLLLVVRPVRVLVRIKLLAVRLDTWHRHQSPEACLVSNEAASKLP
jgi:hypothetical protein